MSDSLWTPEIIATIVYRVMMILVSLAFIRKEYRQHQPQLDEEQLIDMLIRQQTFSPSIGMSSATQNINEVNTPPAPRLREHVRANWNIIFASALGLDATTPAPVPLRQLSRLPHSPVQTTSNTSHGSGQKHDDLAAQLCSSWPPGSSVQTKSSYTSEGVETAPNPSQASSSMSEASGTRPASTAVSAIKDNEHIQDGSIRVHSSFSKDSVQGHRDQHGGPSEK